MLDRIVIVLTPHRLLPLPLLLFLLKRPNQNNQIVQPNTINTMDPEPTVVPQEPAAGAAPSSAIPPGASANQAASSNVGNASLYVGDLHPEVTEAVLFESFSSIGPLTTIRVCRDNVTRRSLGYAYVNFVNPEDARQAMDKLNYEEIRGQPCRIMWSQRDPSVRRSNAGNIFIKSLEKSIGNKELLDTFSQFGEVLSCKVKTDSQGNSLGYGFVHYETPEAAQEAIEKVNGKLLNKQKVYVGPFMSQSERLENMDKAATRFTNVFVKNLPSGYTEEKLEALFAPFGKITSRKVMNKDHDGAEKTIAFVAFEDSESAQAAVHDMNDQEVEGNKLFVDRAQSKAERQALLRRDYERRKADMQHSTKGINLFVKNLDPSIDDEKLRNIFGEFGTITSAVVMKDDKGVSKGFGFVCYSDSQEATNAQVNLNKKMIEGKPLYVALAQRRDERKQELAMAAHNRMQSMRGMPMGYPMMQPQANMMYAMQQARGGYPYVPRPRFGPPMGMPPQYMQQRPPQMGGGRGMPTLGPRGASRGGPPRQPRGPPRPQGPGQPQFRQQVRNLGQPPQMMSQAAPEQAQLVQPGQAPLTLQALAQESEETQKQMLGERLYPLIEATQSLLAGKITGMLLEMDVSELVNLATDPAALEFKIAEAVSVLEEHGRAAGEDITA